LNTSKRSVKFKESFGSRTTVDGPQTVTVSANGFKATTVTLSARAFDGRYDQVILGESKSL